MNDIEILERAYAQETNPRNGDKWRDQGWSQLKIGAAKQDIQRLLEGEFIELVNHSVSYKSYRLTNKGRGTVLVDGHPRPPVPASKILDAMELIIGWEDLKYAIAHTIEEQKRLHYLLSGPPACAKSLFLEAVRQAVPRTGTEDKLVPGAEMAFGSRTSAAGLSDLLFETRPAILLLDEIDKMRADAFSVLLGLMESGEVLETKSRKTRGIKLNTIVMAAGNDISRLPQELISRFSVNAVFPPYTRERFIDVCRQFLAHLFDLSPAVAELIGEMVFDYKLGDFRKARAIGEMMETPTEDEVRRVVNFLVKYSGEKAPPQGRFRQLAASRFAGM